jgi:hypothetical protein
MLLALAGKTTCGFPMVENIAKVFDYVRPCKDILACPRVEDENLIL